MNAQGQQHGGRDEGGHVLPEDTVPRTAGEPIPEPKAPGSGASGLLKSSAVMAAGIIVSRITGFLRTLVMAAPSASAPSATRTRSPTSCPR